MNNLYLVTEVYKGNDGYTKIYTRISNSSHSYATEHWSQTCVPLISIDQVTLEQMLEAIDSALEGANYHDSIGIASRFAEYITEVSNDIYAKLVIWKLINDVGLTLGL